MALTQVKSDGIATGAVTTNNLSDSGVTAGTYGSSSAIPAITVDAKGRITAASTNAISVESDRIFEGNTSAEAVDTGSDGHFKVITEGTEALRVDSSQRVGIGTNSPSNLLHIAGTGTDLTGLRIVNTQHQAAATSTAGLKLGITNSVGQRNCRIQAREEAVDSNAIALDFFTNSADAVDGETVKMTVLHSGNVGIGTTSPAYKCDIDVTGSALRLNSTTTQALLVISSDDAANAKIEFGDESDNDRGAIIYDNPNNALIFQANAAERLRIASTGAFGLSGANYGTSGQVLTSQGSGSAPQWATASTGNDFNFASGSLSGSNIIVNNLPATAMKIVIGIRFVLWSNASTSFYLRLGNSSGIISTGYNAHSGFFGSATSGSSAFTQWFMLNQGFGDTSVREYGTIELNKKNSTEWHMSFTGLTTSHPGYMLSANGALSHSGTIDRLQLAVNTGTFSGTYGVNVFTE